MVANAIGGDDRMEALRDFYGELAKGSAANLAVLIDEKLLDPDDLGRVGEVFGPGFVGLGLALRERLGLPEGIDLQVDFISDVTRQLYQDFRVVEVKRHPESNPNESLPLGALPVVIVQAVASGASTYPVIPTPYLGLQGKPLDQVYEALKSLIFA